MVIEKITLYERDFRQLRKRKYLICTGEYGNGDIEVVFEKEED